MNKQKGITLIALIVTIIVLLILTGITIATLMGEDGILQKAIKAKEETEIKGYQERIELIRNDLRLQNENYEPPSLAQMEEEFNNNQKNWVASTESKQVDEIETLELKTKEGYIFHITMTGTEYKGKGQVVDTSALKREDALKLEIVAEGTNGGKLVQITDLSEVDYYDIEYQINSTEGEWQPIKSGEKVEVGPSSTIYARLSYRTNKGVIVKLSTEASAPMVTAKNTDTSQLERKIQIPLSDLFEITWGSDGTGEVEYQVTGNLNFKNTNYNSTEVNNLSELEVGNYTVTCKVTSPSQKEVTATKQNVNVTKLASTTVTNQSNSNVVAKAIYSEYDLAYFRDIVNKGEQTLNAKLMNNISLTSVCGQEVESWIPIGKVDGTATGEWENIMSYKGVFEGDNKTIFNLYINDNEVALGLFGVMQGGTIKNLKVQGSVSNEKVSNCVAGIVASTIKSEENKKTNLINLQNMVTVCANNVIGVGGIAGSVNNTTIERCCNNVKIIGADCVGGIVGDIKESNTEVNQCYNLGEIGAESVGNFFRI